jgi:hypothetical protein
MVQQQMVSGGHPDMDYAEHERTYAGFITISKWCIAFVVLVLIFMAVTLL